MELDRQKEANKAVHIQYTVYRWTANNTTQPTWKIFLHGVFLKKRGEVRIHEIPQNFSEQDTHRKKH